MGEDEGEEKRSHEPRETEVQAKRSVYLKWPSYIKISLWGGKQKSSPSEGEVGVR